LSQSYKTIENSKQAVDYHQRRQIISDKKMNHLLIEAKKCRKEHPGCSVEKMFDTLKPDFIGRNRLIKAFMELGFRIKRSKNIEEQHFQQMCKIQI
jgi:hypothetical protein